VQHGRAEQIAFAAPAIGAAAGTICIPASSKLHTMATTIFIS
jgi:hypothetical protein